jgi:hypothetical protein
MSDDNDVLIAAANLRGKQLYASRKELEAQLARNVADGDQDEIADTLGAIGVIDRQGEDLNRLYQSHVQSQQPQYRAPDTGEEFRAKPVEKMDGNDALRIVNAGKMPGDPTILSAQEYNNQLAKLRHLKSQGMYKD